MRHKVVASFFVIFIFVFGILTFTKLQPMPVQKAGNLFGFFMEAKPIIKSFETNINENFYKRETFVDFYGLFKKMQGNRIIRDVETSSTVYKDTKGYLHWAYPKVDTLPYANNVVKLNSFLKDKGIPLLYVQAPFKDLKGFTTLPPSVTDYANINADSFLSVLNEKNVPNIDIRSLIEEDGLNPNELFHYTDHHWKTKTAFWAAGKVVKWADEKFQRTTPSHLLNINSYEEKVYKDFFLGSQGRRVGRYFAGVDDYSLLLPKFETEYVVDYFRRDGKVQTKKGSFEKAIISKSLLDPKASVYTNRYACYLGGDNPKVQIKNKNGRGKLLVIQDSFGLVFSSLLSINFNELTLLDLRYYDHKTVQEEIDGSNYDGVVILYNPSCFNAEPQKKFDFGNL